MTLNISANAEKSTTKGINSPNGQLTLNVILNKSGTPVYDLSYKGKAVIKPSKLGLELVNDSLSLMNGFTITEEKTSSYDNSWTPVWGEEKTIRNHYNEMAVTLKQKVKNRYIIIRFRLFNSG